MAFTPEEEAALRGILAIYKSKAAGLSDDLAEKAVGLYDPWTPDGYFYAVGQRVDYNGTLYVCLQPHTSQESWTPSTAPSLWAKNLEAASTPDADTVPDWTQPDATNGYVLGAIVMHNGKKWQSTVANNVWEPGAIGSETLWQEV